MMRIGLGLIGVAALVLGIAIWLGAPPTLARPHMIIGLLFVVVLWIMAGTALARGRARGPAAGLVILGVVIIAVGYLQQRWLPGEYHWTIRTLHLLLGLSGMALARRVR
jgi:hypothetical protein